LNVAAVTCCARMAKFFLPRRLLSLGSPLLDEGTLVLPSLLETEILKMLASMGPSGWEDKLVVVSDVLEACETCG
jgi:hypothetical protein